MKPRPGDGSVGLLHKRELRAFPQHPIDSGMAVHFQIPILENRQGGDRHTPELSG